MSSPLAGPLAAWMPPSSPRGWFTACPANGEGIAPSTDSEFALSQEHANKKRLTNSTALRQASKDATTGNLQQTSKRIYHAAPPLPPCPTQPAAPPLHVTHCTPGRKPAPLWHGTCIYPAVPGTHPRV
ncbi:hypothetical protein XFF6166_350007 [Xanthomonas citri pv. fuscans]|nr:hypothetical protein XFF6166_350007 [Xanthomonas citri pv. fuscans]SOO02721.1 hypothetical protein XFF6960_690007 [Xanthomonas citri pv. fuscans]SOO06015.1 hypothetical protein XFF7767_570007 [Xanthomonas citri pv. fuscans]SOO11853.1 hypothetical protein XFF6970_960152 [Xanthomonas citri pv. fuscans]SOO16113.1 hypothetical protein XFF7766_740007 [Xanthomonas citri pv. fuscans]